MVETKPEGGTTLVVPAFKHCKELRLDNSSWELAKSRMREVQHLVPSNYSSLEFTFQEAWREARRNAIMTEDAVKKALQTIEEIKADIILTEIPKLLEDMPKNANNTDFRKAVITKNSDYKQATEHLEKLQAILAHLESNMKIMENTSRFMKKQMDYIIRSGVVGPR
jgi:predicted Zn-dependent protease